MTDVGKATIRFEADTSQADKAIKQTEKAFVNSGKEIDKAFSKVNRAAFAAAGTVAGLTTSLVLMSRKAFAVAADVSEMNVAIGAIGKSSGYGATNIRQAAESIRGMGIEMKAAQEIALLFVKGNMDLSKAAKMARVAQDLAVISQANSTQTAQTLAYAIQTGNSRLLKSAGITKYASEAYDEMAASLGKSVSQLTASERQTAVLNLILEEGKKVAGTYEAAMTESGKVLRSFPRIINDIQLAFGKLFLAGFGPVIKSAYDATKAFSKLVREGGYLNPIIKELGEAFTNLTSPLIKFFKSWTSNMKQLNKAKLEVSNLNVQIEKFAPLVLSAVSAISAFFGGQALGMLSPKLGQLARFMNPVLVGFATLVVTTPKLRSAVADLAKAMEPMLKALMQLGAQLSQTTYELLNAFVEVFVAVAKVLAPVIEALGKVAQMLTKIGPLMEGVIYYMIAMKVQALHLGTRLGVMALTMQAGVVASLKKAKIAMKAFIASCKPLLALTVAFVAITKIFSWWSNRNREAEERAASLTKELSEQKHETTQLIQNFKDLAKTLPDYTEAMHEHEQSMGKAAGAATFLAEVVDNDLLPAFDSLLNAQNTTLLATTDAGVSLREVASSIGEAGGAYKQLQEDLGQTSNQDGFNEYMNVLKNAPPVINDVTSALAAQMKQGILTVGETWDMIQVLVDMEAAWATHAVTMNDNAKAYFKSAEGASELIRVLGDTRYIELLAEAERGNMDWVTALRTAFEEAEAIKAEAERELKRQQAEYEAHYRRHKEELERVGLGGWFIATGNAISESAGAIDPWLERMKKLTNIQDDVDTTMEEWLAEFYKGTGNVTELAKEMYELQLVGEEWLGTLSELDPKTADLTRVGYELWDMFHELGLTMANAGMKTSEIAGSQLELVAGFYQEMEAAGYLKEELDKLILSMGMLDGFVVSADILINLVGDTEGIDAMIQAYEVALWMGGDAVMARQAIDTLKAMRDILGGTGGRGPKYRKPSYGAGGTGAGGGGGPTGPSAGELWSQGIEGLAGMWGPDMGQWLVGATPEQIADSIDQILTAGLELVGTGGTSSNKLKEILTQLGQDSEILQSMSQLATDFTYDLIDAEDALAVATDNLTKAKERQHRIQEQGIAMMRDEVAAAKQMVMSSEMLKTRNSGVVFSAEEVLGKYTRWEQGLKEMSDKGFPPSLIAEAYMAGPDGGIIDQMKNMDPEAILNYTQTMDKISKIAESVAGYGFGALYGGALADADADVNAAQAGFDQAQAEFDRLSGALDETIEAIRDFITIMQTDFLNGLNAIIGTDGSGSLSSLITQLATGVTGPNQQLGTTEITINMPEGSDGDDVVRALQDYMRRNGSVPILTVAP